MEYEAKRRVEASARTFAIVEHLSLMDRVGVSALAEELDMNKGIIHNHLSTLRELGYVTKVSDEYTLSPKFLSIGLNARTNNSLYQFASGPAAELAQQYSVGIFCCQEAGADCIIVDSYEVSRPRGIETGATLPLRESLPGVVLSVARTDQLTKEQFSEYDIEEVRSKLAAEGHTVGHISAEMPEMCVAVPIIDDTGDCPGCIGAVVPEGYTEQQLGDLSEEMVSLRDSVERRFESGWSGERSFATEKHEWIN